MARALCSRHSRCSACCVPLPEGLQNDSKLPAAIHTSAANANMGKHDENITFVKTVDMVGADVAGQSRDLVIALYKATAEIALKTGIIMADTQLEFGSDKAGNVELIGDVLTHDSSCYWPTGRYVAIESPSNDDKQMLRDWLENAKASGHLSDKPPSERRLPDGVIEKTAAKYQ